MKEENEINLELSATEANEMLQNKIAELNAANAELNAAKKEILSIQSRSLKVYEENQLLQHSPQYAQQAAEMKFQLEMAKRFSASGAFPKLNPEQVYVLMKAGQEMGMKPMESLNSLYIINGKIEPYGKAMPALLTKNGYTTHYSNETPEGCTVTVTKGDEKIVEHVSKNDLTKLNGAYAISPKNKLRFHGLRMVLNFHLPHLISGCSDLFDSSVVEENKSNSIAETENNKQKSRIIEHIEKSKSVDDLQRVGKMVDQYDLREMYDEKMKVFTSESIEHEAI